MNRSYAIGIIVAVLLIIGLIIYFSVRNDDTTETPDTVNGPATTSNQQPTPTSTTPYSFVEIAEHNTPSDCWITYGDKVYDITDFIPRYSGDRSMLNALCGRDGTPTIDYLGTNVINQLGQYEIGFLEAKL